MLGRPFNPIKNFHRGYNPPEYAARTRPTTCVTQPRFKSLLHFFLALKWNFINGIIVKWQNNI